MITLWATPATQEWLVAAISTAVACAVFIWARSLRLYAPATPRERGDAGLINKTGSSSPNLREAQSKAAEFGEWKPRKFAYPAVDPLSTPIRDIEPIMYRPFKAGTQHITMGIRSMVWNEWIELDNQFERYYHIRKYRIQERREKLIRVLDDGQMGNGVTVRGGGLAAIEFVHELAAYLAARYPSDFHITRHERDRLGEALTEALPERVSSTSRYCDWGWEGACPIKTITVVALNATYELPLHVGDGERAPERALEVAAYLAQDDFALMLEGDDGRYYLQAGAIVVPGFWRIEDKIGLPLDEIHTSGDVPRYREKLQGSMERFFRRMEVETPVARNNFFFQVVRSKEQPTAQDIVDPTELGWGVSSNGPEDAFELAHAFEGPTTTPRIEEMYLRTERQTLRRLGASGAIVFTIRTYLVPMTALASEAGAAARLASALRGMGEDIREYKGVYRGRWLGMVLEYLDDRGHEGPEM